MEKWVLELDNMKDEYRELVMKGIRIIQSEFPVINTISLRITIGERDLYNPATTKTEKYGFKYRHIIYLSSYYFSFEDHLCDLKRYVTSSDDENRFYNNYTDIIIHELGHVMQDLYCLKYMPSCKNCESISSYIRWFRGRRKEKKFLERLTENIWQELELDAEKCSYCLGNNSIRMVYEFYADCFNTYYYLLGDDTITRENTREYKAFKISEYVVNMMKKVD